MVAVDEPQAPAIGGDVHRVVHHLHPAKVVVGEVARKLVVVAWHKHHLGALARLAQDLLDDIVVRLGPEPAPAQLPAVNDVTQQVQVIARVSFQKFKQGFGLATGCAQVQV